MAIGKHPYLKSLDLGMATFCRSDCRLCEGAKASPANPLMPALRSRNFSTSWGRVEYDDGFGVSRFTNFCYRYNWENERAIPNGEGRRHIPAEDGRYHVYGNDAN